VADFFEAARILDRQRLNKQRVECYQILQTLAGISTTHSWANHPAVWMWKGSELSLAEYGITMCDEWRRRGYTDNMAERIVTLVQDAMYQHVWGPTNAGAPYWMGAEGFHLSHKSNLILKDPEYYQKYWPDIPPGLPYIWPPYRGE
jgi:hypothetical protein